MKYSLLVLVLFLSVGIFSQTSDSVPLNKEFQEFRRQNTVGNLMKYKGLHNAKSVDEYRYANNEWIFSKTDSSIAQISYFDCYLTFKRSHFKRDLTRFLYFDL